MDEIIKQLEAMIAAQERALEILGVDNIDACDIMELADQE
jgi:hypothetical protein